LLRYPTPYSDFIVYLVFYDFFLCSHPLKLSQRLKDPLKRYNGRQEVQSSSVFNSTNIVALIGIVLTVIVMMSLRLASIMSHDHPILLEGTKANIDAMEKNNGTSSSSTAGISCSSQSGNNNATPTTPNEYSKLLV